MMKPDLLLRRDSTGPQAGARSRGSYDLWGGHHAGRRQECQARGSEAAYLTLVRASTFLASRSWGSAGGDGLLAGHPGPSLARWLGNGLGELDRFLNVLIEEAAGMLAPAGFDHRAFARRHNTANKLRDIRAMMALGSPEHERLRAIGRLREQFRRGGSAQHRLILCGGPQTNPLCPASVQTIFAPADLESICTFYTITAQNFFTQLTVFRSGIVFSGGDPYFSRANVACDGI